MNARLPAKPVCLALALLVIAGCSFDYSDFFTSDADFLTTGKTMSFFSADQIDPRSEDSAGPQFVVAEDLNNDGLIDLVSAWNQSQPIQIHLQHRTDAGQIWFETITLAGNIPVIKVAGLVIADFDQDGRPDIAAMIKSSLLDGAGCLSGELPTEGISGVIVVYLAPDDLANANRALAWEEVTVGASLLAGAGDGSGLPEEDGFTSMAVGDVDGDGDFDIVAAWNGACNTSQVLFFQNQGPLQTRDGTWALEAIPDAFTSVPIKDVALADIDHDGDLDVVVTRPTAGGMNVRWCRNPIIDVQDDFHISDGQWQVGTIGQIDTGADIIEMGDIDGDGIADVVMRSTFGGLVQWFKGPQGPTTAPVRSIPWQVYTLAEFTQRTPQALALGDITGDGRIEVIVSAEGGLAWFDSQAAPSTYDQWTENLIIDDEPSDGSSGSPSTTDPNVSPQDVGGGTMINCILVVDLDGDGANDLVVTLDRSGLSGLTNDALVWFRNTR